MKAEDPKTGEWKYFVDKCLPFGASISCALFQCFSDAICFLTENKSASSGQTTNYLDDFLFIALSFIACNGLISDFLQLCEEIGVLYQFLWEKLNGPWTLR